MFLCPQCPAPTNGPRCPSGHTAVPIPGLEGWRAGGLKGVGGFARVYECFEGEFRRAIKVVDPTQAEDPESLRDAFRREHRALSRLTHAHVIALIHAEEVAGLLCLATEFVPLTLADVFRPGHPLALPRAVHLAAQLADGLAYMHDEGISHRDLKPKNIGLERDDHLRLFDFGLSGQHRADGPTSRDVRGFSRPYAAPEQLLPDVYGPAGPWSDRYSFAAVLYELLTGRGHRPRGMELGYQVYVDQPIPPLPVDAGRPPELDRLILDCLKVHPDQRPRDTWPIQDLLADLSDRLGAGYGEARARFVEVRDELGKKADELKALERRRAALIGESKGIEAELSARRAGATAALEAEIRALAERHRALEVENASVRDRAQAELTTSLDFMRAAQVKETRGLEQRRAEGRKVQAALAQDEAAARAELARLQTAVEQVSAELQGLESKAKSARRRRLLTFAVPLATLILGLGLGLILPDQNAADGGAPTAPESSRGLTPFVRHPETPALTSLAGTPAPVTQPPPAPAPKGAEPISEAAFNEPPPGAPGYRAFLATDTRPALRLVPSGPFKMGSPPDEAGRDGDETQHGVKLTQPYLMFDTEVTQAQWKAVVGTSPSNHQDCDTCPVEQVSWWDAVAWANALSEKEGLTACYKLSDCKGKPGTDEHTCASMERTKTCTGYRLPTEAEWERAARAGGTEARHGEPDAVGWYDKNSGTETHPVGGKAANAWGLRDMLGNVWEWCEDVYDKYPPGPAVDPAGPAGGRRVFRGGSFGDDAAWLRSANRHGGLPGLRLRSLGFRLVR